MHLINITRANPIGLSLGWKLAEDINAGEMLARGWCTVTSPNGGIAIRPITGSTKKVLFVRPGGFGDLLFLTPTFAEWKRRNPKMEIWVACFQRYHGVLLHNPDVDGFIDYPVKLDEWETFDAQVWLECAIEENKEAETMHAVDVISHRAGIELSDKRMRYFVTEDEQAAAVKEFPHHDNLKRIGLQMGGNAGNMLRMYSRMKEVSQLLWRSAHEVFLFGAPGDFRSNEPDGIVNLMQRGKKFRESAAILETCDCVVAPDSALVHVAGALGIPCVGLYGPFPWKLRTAYAENTFSIQGTCPISPCFHHVRPGTGEFPANGPCARTGKCEAMESITPERIVREVEKMLDIGRKGQSVAA